MVYLVYKVKILSSLRVDKSTKLSSNYVVSERHLFDIDVTVPTSPSLCE